MAEVIADRPEALRGEGDLQAEKAGDIGADQRISQQDIRKAGFRGHFRLGDGGAFAAGNAQPLQQLQYLRAFMGFHMRPEALGAAGHFDGAQRIGANLFGIKDEGGRKALRRAGKIILHGKLLSYFGQPKMVCGRSFALPGKAGRQPKYAAKHLRTEP